MAYSILSSSSNYNRFKTKVIQYSFIYVFLWGFFEWTLQHEILGTRYAQKSHSLIDKYSKTTNSRAVFVQPTSRLCSRLGTLTQNNKHGSFAVYFEKVLFMFFVYLLYVQQGFSRSREQIWTLIAIVFTDNWFTKNNQKFSSALV